MGIQSRTNPTRRSRWLAAALLAVVAALLLPQNVWAQTTSATTVPLILPAGLAYDAAGNLVFAEAGRHLIRQVSPAGLLTTIAGTGTQGFSGDGGPATAATLDTPTAVAFDAAGNLFFADSHNGRVRRIAAGTGTVTTVAASVHPSALAIDAAGNIFVADTGVHRILRLNPATGAVVAVAGNGVQGFAGDGGPASAASLDTPYGLAVDSAGNLFLADSHNHRVRRVDAATGVITTLASARLPRGLTVDALGSVTFADRSAQQVFRVSATGAVTLVAGTGTQGYAGDGSPAVAARLDSPGAVTLSPAGLVTVSDSANGRVRQVDAAAVIHTIAGLGASASATLTLAAPNVLPYGQATDIVTATLAASPATGTVTFFDTENSAAPQTLATGSLSANAASYAAQALAAGPHRILATYSGDGLHAAAESTAIALLISPAPLTATPDAVSLVYGQAVPPLTGTLTGVLAPDVLTLALSSTATAQSPPAAYPIAAAVTGAAAANYVLTVVPAAVTIARAPATATLAATGSATLTAQVASTTAGVPTGVVTLLDASAAAGSASLTASAGVSASATFSTAGLSAGTHTLTVSYAGDTDFLPSVSPPITVSISSAPQPDFSLTANGSTSQTVPAGSAAQYSFAVAAVNGALASPIVLSASGLPAGATASFNPAYLPPSASPAAFIVTIATPKARLETAAYPYLLALLVPLVLLTSKRRRRALVLLAAALPLGCGDRINNTAASVSTVAYTITITATATQANGVALVHAATVTLNVQH